jgi:hypothetical protein
LPLGVGREAPELAGPLSDIGERPPEFHLGRIAIGVYLDLVDLTREGGDVLGPLIEAAVLEANIGAAVEGFVRSGDLRALERPLPPEVMRPVSVHALAASLRLPYETVRRRAGSLAEEGRLVRDRGGVHVAPGWMTRPAAARRSRLRHERLQRLHRDVLENLGPEALGLTPAPAPPVRSGPPLQFIDHLANGYMLRLSELLTAELGDPFAGFVLLNVVRANIRHLPLEDSKFGAGGAGARRPARPTPLSKTLGVAPETLRRHVRRLERAGFLVRAEGGVILDDQAFRSRLAFALIGVAVGAIRRILSQMARAGLLAAETGGPSSDDAPTADEA